MKLSYDAETDSLYIELKAGPGVETIRVAEGLMADVDAAGEIVGFDIHHASRLDLTRIETSGFPDDATRAA